MVSAQLIPFGESSGIIKSILAIPREMFLEEPDRQIVYRVFENISSKRILLLSSIF